MCFQQNGATSHITPDNRGLLQEKCCSTSNFDLEDGNWLARSCDLILFLSGYALTLTILNEEFKGYNLKDMWF